MKFKVKKAWKKLGPGLITGSSDDDPSGIATYSQAGAGFGLATLWTAFITYPLMYSIQEMCARIAIVTGCGLINIIKHYYRKPFLYLLLLICFPAITFNIAADLAGMGAIANLLLPDIPIFVFSSLIIVILLTALLFFDYRKMASFLKWLCISLFAYIIVPFLVKQDWNEVLKAALIPHIKWNKEFISILVAILGTTISPYLFFWQANMSVEERNHKSDQTDKKEIKDMKIDVNAGMLFSNIVMFFIILTTGTVLFPAGVTQIETVQEAALALKPLAGKYAHFLFALGVIGTGLLAIPVLSGCLGYMFAEAFGWERGLDKKLKEAKGFYMVILASMVIALLLNLIGLNPIKSLIYSAILYGFITPFLIMIIMFIANSKPIMGKFVNKKLSNILGIATLILTTGAAVALIVTWFE
jgi:NRAMP (natural resistance-associated macrophage protein)-like metal ion transporter